MPEKLEQLSVERHLRQHIRIVPLRVQEELPDAERHMCWHWRMRPESKALQARSLWEQERVLHLQMPWWLPFEKRCMCRWVWAIKKWCQLKMEPKRLVMMNKRINYLHVFADIDECSVNSYLCHGKGRACVNTEPSYKCVCQRGFRKVGDSCEDIDECATPNVCQHGNCSNSAGSYSCACNKGFVFKNGRCEGV